MKANNINNIKAANKAAGGSFFDKDAIDFFRSHVKSQVYGGRYFITSEQFTSESPRLYTVRESLPDGHIRTVGEFQAYTTAREARAKARELALIGEEPRDVADDGRRYED